MRSLLRHGWHDGHSRCTGPDDHNPFAVIIQIFWPVLRMGNLSAKGVKSGPFRKIAVFIVIIAGAGGHEFRHYQIGLPIGRLHRRIPTFFCRGPIKVGNSGSQPDAVTHCKFVNCVIEVVQYFLTGCDIFR